MKIIWGGAGAPEINAAIERFVKQRIPGCSGGWDRFTSMGVVHDNALIAGIIYHNYCPDAQVIELSGAADHKIWLNRHVLREMYRYPLEELKCQAVIHRIPDEDDAQHRMLLTLGGLRYRIPRLRGPSAAENIYVITREAWSNNKFNQKKCDEEQEYCSQ
ncbi:hypothetical protein B488_07750 [Liberibacter crescens BT-1]|uniref:Uncharacterized protein n=1 Tax=Liberibacter crescens (strain BT-1) TaxID=1215343 RepID=L0EUY0_LIBCB|nr:hypothetical protein [Liberibacter crescens]AGA64767.1 hypothetical protein B488_07750 [Liberibacter crescens BT-1]AMC12838.1 hypothetical protein RL73_03930 [Liberibacter crescens]